MKNLSIITIFCSIILFSCGGGNGNGGHSDIHGVNEAGVHFDAYGEEFKPENVVDIHEVAKNVTPGKSFDCTFKGEIVESCQKMGCWMSVKGTGEEPMMVFMKDHDFFVPRSGVTDLECYVKGTAYMDTLSVDWLQHLAEDAGKSQEEIDAITEPKFALAFTADGVIIEDFKGEVE